MFIMKVTVGGRVVLGCISEYLLLIHQSKDAQDRPGTVSVSFNEKLLNVLEKVGI